MIQVTCRDEKITYTAFHLVKAFFPQEEARVSVSGDGSFPARIRAEDGGGLCIQADSAEALYLKLRQQTGKDLPWGMLTGVRPVKLAAAWIEEHLKEYPCPQDAKASFLRYFREEKFVSDEKASLAFDIAFREQTILRERGLFRKGASLYAGIPFCPSICRYCSFSSGSIGRFAGKVDLYLEALSREMKARKESYFPGEQWPDTVYVGGGTPTSLSAAQLRSFLGEMEQIFDLRRGLAQNRVKEYTVEAGRPDSITREKLRILKEYGVTRISVNPQTMNPDTLALIGRAHTPWQIREAFYLAREEGFDNINMDLIMGLPGETAEDAEKTLEQIEEMGPDSLTVHTLAIKRASAMGIERRRKNSQTEKEPEDAGPVVERMIQSAYHKALSMKMAPYYLYRQKMIAGNFENIGYARPGKEGLYNILIMEEIQSIIACGAGACTKLVFDEAVPDPARGGKLCYITRQENVRDIDEYIRRSEC